MSDLIYENYNKRSVAVRGNKNKYQKAMKEIGGQWKQDMKNGPGWLIPKENENELQRLIKSFQKIQKNENIAEHVKSKKNKNRYHRENSESENSANENNESENSASENSSNKNSSSESSLSENEESNKKDEYIPPLVAKLLKSERSLEKKSKQQESYRNYRRSEESRNLRQEENDHIDYYKSFNQKPASFREKNKLPIEKDEEYSSSNNSRDSSPDNYPNPNTPIKKNSKYRDKDYNNLFSKMENLQIRIDELERGIKSRR